MSGSRHDNTVTENTTDLTASGQRRGVDLQRDVDAYGVRMVTKINITKESLSLPKNSSQAKLAEEIKNELATLATKVTIFTDVNHKKLREFCGSERTLERMNKIAAAMKALSELRKPDGSSKLNDEDITSKMEQRILEIMQHELLKVHILVAKKIADDERALKHVLHETSSESDAEALYRHKEIMDLAKLKRDKEKQLFKSIKASIMGDKYADQLKDFPATTSFFSKYEKTSTKLRGHLEKSDRLADAAFMLANAAALAVPVIEMARHASDHTVKALSNPIWNIGSGMWAAASGIPMIAAVAAVVPAALNSMRSWLGNKGWSDRAITTTMAGVFITAAVLTIVFPVAAAGITAGIIAAGVVMNNVKPYFELRTKINERNNDSTAIDARLKELDSFKQKPSHHMSLTMREIHVLMQYFEQYARNKGLDNALLIQVRDSIKEGSINELNAQINSSSEAGKILKSALKLDDNKSLTDFLIDNNSKHKQHLVVEIASLKSQRASQRNQAINGVVTTIGAIMVCIPFPPVMITGAVLLLASSAVGISLKYNLHGKAWNALKKLVTGDKSTNPVTADNIKHDKTPAPAHNLSPPANTNKNALSSTAVLGHNMPKARATTMAATIHDDATVLASANTSSVKVPKLNLDNIRTEPEQTRADGETRPRSGLTSVSSSFFHRPNAAAVAEVTANTLDKSSEKTNETSTLRLSKK